MKLKFFKILALAAVMVGLPAITSCKEDEPEIGGSGSGSGFSIESKYLNHSINAERTVIEIPVNTSMSNSQWYIDPDVTWIMASKKGPNNGVGTVTLTVDENNTGEIRTGIVKISTTTVDYKVTIKQYADNQLIVEEDIPVKPISGTATNFQPGSGIELTWDDDVTTMFHSNWGAANRFPFELLYRFQGQEEIDYVEYVPREGGGNGAFQEFELYYAEDAARSDFKQVGEVYNFNGSSSPQRVNLPGGKKPTAVKFVVKSGVGGFVSCAEMRFMRRNTESALDTELLKVFTDLTCSELNPGVTMADIETLDPVFQRIGEALLNGTYDSFEKSFRVHEYQAYSDPVEWATKLMTKKYSNWDNPMGIAVKKDEPVMILVGDTYGNNLSVQIVGEYSGTNSESGKTYVTTQRQGHFVSINPGVNKIVPDQDGQLFLMYTAVPSASKPIKVHVPLGSGTLCGYFDLEEHKTDEKYAEIMQKTSHKYMCIKGKRMLLYFRRTTLPSKIVDPINQWDNIITWQQNFMGVDDVRPSQWNNHLAGITLPDDEGGYMWASDWTMGFTESAVSKIMGLTQFNAAADNAWGPAHEMGHVNQTAINWASTTESSNNLFSNYVLYRFGRYHSRGKGLYYRFGAVYEKDHSWANMAYEFDYTGPAIPSAAISGGSTHQGEDPEIHMRMNWQLWNYYHRVKKDEKFFARVFAKMRAVGLNETENCGKKQLEFAVACSEAAGEDLTDFFEAWGFFKAHSSTVNQYGSYPYVVNESQIRDAKERMAKFPKAGAVEYIEDRSTKETYLSTDFALDKVGDLGYYTTYEKQLKVSSSATATVSGRNVVTRNCTNAVGIEVRVKKGDSYGEIRFASNYVEFTIPTRINITGCALYAVQEDGARIFLANL